jgi:glycosyltransferase involved in cell wall biosynthesis
MKPLSRLVGEVDLVHCAIWDASLLARVVALARRRPVTVADHSTDRALQVSEAGRPCARWIALHHRALSPFHFATIVCAATQRPPLLREGVASERIVHIANGVPLEDLRRAARVAVTRERLGNPGPRLCGAARRAPCARPQPARNSGRSATLRRTLCDVHAVFVGDGPDRSAPKRAEELGARTGHTSLAPGRTSRRSSPWLISRFCRRLTTPCRWSCSRRWHSACRLSPRPSVTLERSA